MSASLQGIIFDKDGTLFDFRTTWEVWTRGFLLRLAKNDESHARAMGQLIGFDLDTSQFDPNSVVIAGTPGDIADALDGAVDMERDALITLSNQEAAQAPQSEVVPLVPFFEALRGRGLRIGVATNDAEQPARAHLAAAGVLDQLDFVAGFDSGFGGKPGAGQLLAFCAATGCAPDRVAMVGDSTHDLMAGKAAGMVRVAVLTGLATEASLAPYADVVLPDIGHILGWIET